MFKDKVVIITGGARGVGFAAARKMLENHAKVIIFDKNQEKTEKSVQELKKMNEAFEIAGMWPNLRDYQSVYDAIHEVADKYGRIDILVSNAGITGMGDFYSYTPEYFNEVMGVNLFGGFNCAHSVAPIMKEQGGGVIVFTSSNTAFFGTSGGCAYPVSKAAVNALVRNLGRELAKDQIRVVGVAPGLVDTDMVAGISDEVRQMVAGRNPQGRFGTADENADVILFLASDAAKRITAITVPVAGGGMD